MKKAGPWIRVVGFIVGIFIMVMVFDYIFAQSGYVRYVLTYFKNSEDNIDTLVLGASHARSAIDPEKIDEVNDTNSFSLAIPGETVKDSYYVLEEACRSKNIKTVILDIDYQYWMNPQGEGYFQEPFIYNQLEWSSPVKWQYMVQNMFKLDIRNAFTKKNVYLCTPGSVAVNVKQKNSEAYKNADIYSLDVADANGPYMGKGFFSRVTSGSMPGGDDYIETWIGRQNMGFSDMAVTKFKQMKKYCDDNGIELICVTSPITPGVMKTLGMEKVDGLFTSFFEEQNVTYYNFNKARLDILARKDTDYGDKEGHMGGELAERYSEVLAEVLKGHFNNALDKSKYFYDTFEQMYEEMEEQ